MTMRDSANHMLIKRAISPVAPNDNTPQVSQIIDRQGFQSLMFAIAIGTLGDAGATFTLLIEHGNDPALGDAVAVPDADMISQTPGAAPETAAAFDQDDDDEVRKIGYIGDKRYVRLTITPAGNGAAAYLAAIAILSGGPVPVSQSAA